MVIASNLKDANYSLSSLDTFNDKDSISENLKKYVAIAVENGLMKGFDDGTFKPKATLTRAQVSQLVKNAEQVKEKIAVIDSSDKSQDIETSEQNETKLLEDIVYSYRLGRLDLGVNWNNYIYTWDTSANDTTEKLLDNLKNKKRPCYYPSQRYLYYYYGEDETGNLLGGADDTKFSGVGRVMVANKNNISEYKIIDCKDPFDGIRYDKEADTLKTADTSLFK